MKRSLLFSIPLLCAIHGYSQHVITSGVPATKHSMGAAASADRGSAPVANPSTTVLYSEDFSTGLPSSWTVTDNAGNGEVWTYTTVGSASMGQLDTVGTTAENGYMMFDSDAGGTGNAENCDLTSPAINCSGQTQIYLAFNQWYWEYATDSAYVGVSTDGVNWTYIYCPDTTLDNYEAGPNPERIILDISTVASNQSTIYLKFHYEGNFDWWWFVDDVAVYVPDAVDAVAVSSDALVSGGYTQVPIAQASYIPLSATVRNNGGGTISGATALIDVIDNATNAVIFTTNATVPTLAPLASANITGQFTFYTTALGDYRTAVRIYAAGDADTSNNTFSSAEITTLSDSVFARDLGPKIGWVANGSGIGGIMGTNFTLNNSDVLTSVSIFLDSSMINGVNPNGTPIWLTIHDQNAALEPTTTPIATTDTLMATPGFIVSSGAGGQWFTFTISGGPLWLNAGTYMIGINEYDSAMVVGTSAGIYTPGTNWVTWSTIPSPPANNGWATIEAFVPPLTLMLRANFGPVVNGVNENQPHSEFSVFPNPANEQITLTFTSQNVRTVEILNSLGQVVKSEISNKTTTQLDMTALAAGAYFVRVTENGNVSLKPINIVR